jgi:hypothetical protein
MRLGRRLSTGTAEDPTPAHLEPATPAVPAAVEDAAPAPEVAAEVRREYADAADR